MTSDNGSLEPGVSSYLSMSSDARLRLAHMTSVPAPRSAPYDGWTTPLAPHLTCRDRSPGLRSRNHVMSSHMHTVPSRITPAVSIPRGFLPPYVVLACTHGSGPAKAQYKRPTTAKEVR